MFLCFSFSLQQQQAHKSAMNESLFWLLETDEDAELLSCIGICFCFDDPLADVYSY